MTGGRNDCEPVVRRRYPAVAEALDWLGRFAPARLTGTGSCVYAAMPGEAEAARAALARPAGALDGLRGARPQSLAAGRRGANSSRTGRGPAADECDGVSPSGKAAGFDPAIRRFESFHPSQPAAAGDDDEESGTSPFPPNWRVSRDGRPDDGGVHRQCQSRSWRRTSRATCRCRWVGRTSAASATAR